MDWVSLAIGVIIGGAMVGLVICYIIGRAVQTMRFGPFK